MPLSTEQQEIYVSIWAKAVDTQMHFNEMSVKSRQFGLAFVAASLGLGIVMFMRNEEFTIPIHLCGGFNLHMTVVIAFASAFALYAPSSDTPPKSFLKGRSRNRHTLNSSAEPSASESLLFRPSPLRSPMGLHCGVSPAF